MKKTITTLTLIICSYNLIAQWEQTQNAFCPAINLSMGMRKASDNMVKVQGGLKGERIPLSLFVGGHYLEFANDAERLGYKMEGTWGVNATLEWRLIKIDLLREMEGNIYTSVYKDRQNCFYELGGKVGVWINSRSRIAINTGTIQNYLSSNKIESQRYKSFVAGFSFVLLFNNYYYN